MITDKLTFGSVKIIWPLEIQLLICYSQAVIWKTFKAEKTYKTHVRWKH